MVERGEAIDATSMFSIYCRSASQGRAELFFVSFDFERQNASARDVTTYLG